MKFLLDECITVEFRHDMPGHGVFTVACMGWKGIKNGRLLGLAAADRFDALVTTDRGIEHQQNPATLPLAVIILHASNVIEDLRAIVPNLLSALVALAPEAVTHVHP